MGGWDKVLEARYWNPAIMDGAIPICHLGCALRQWLVIHGEQRGFVWNDFRADYRGLSPVLGGSGEPVTFSDWYMGWLDDSFMKAGESPCSTVVPLGGESGGALVGTDPRPHRACHRPTAEETSK